MTNVATPYLKSPYPGDYDILNLSEQYICIQFSLPYAQEKRIYFF